MDGTICNIQCYNCNKCGHISNNCSEPDLWKADSNFATGGHGGNQGLHFFQTSLIFNKDGQTSVTKDMWMCSDNTNMASVTNNEYFVTDVRQFLDDDVLFVLTNGGSHFCAAGTLYMVQKL